MKKSKLVRINNELISDIKDLLQLNITIRKQITVLNGDIQALAERIVILDEEKTELCTRLEINKVKGLCDNCCYRGSTPKCFLKSDFNGCDNYDEIENEIKL